MVKKKAKELRNEGQGIALKKQEEMPALMSVNLCLLKADAGKDCCRDEAPGDFMMYKNFSFVSYRVIFSRCCYLKHSIKLLMMLMLLMMTLSTNDNPLPPMMLTPSLMQIFMCAYF